MQWATVTRFNGGKLSDVLVHVPNGAFHGADRKAGAVVALKLRKKGLQAGVFDYLLTVPLWHQHCPGLWLEMKRTRGGVVSQEQEKFRVRMLELGWRCEIAKGWVVAQDLISDYLKEWR
jgi:hypothetical protein